MNDEIKINYVTKIEITVMHENINDTQGLDDVLQNIVRSWDYEITPSVYQKDPITVDEKLREWVKEWIY